VSSEKEVKPHVTDAILTSSITTSGTSTQFIMFALQQDNTVDTNAQTSSPFLLELSVHHRFTSAPSQPDLQRQRLQIRKYSMDYNITPVKTGELIFGNTKFSKRFSRVIIPSKWNHGRQPL